MSKRMYFDLSNLQRRGVLIEFLDVVNRMAHIEHIPVSQLSRQSNDNIWLKDCSYSVTNSFNWALSDKEYDYWNEITCELERENSWIE